MELKKIKLLVAPKVLQGAQGILWDLVSLLTRGHELIVEKKFVVEAIGTGKFKFKEDFSPIREKNHGIGALKGEILKSQISREKEW